MEANGGEFGLADAIGQKRQGRFEVKHGHGRPWATVDDLLQGSVEGYVSTDAEHLIALAAEGLHIAWDEFPVIVGLAQTQQEGHCFRGRSGHERDRLAGSVVLDEDFGKLICGIGMRFWRAR